MMSTKTKEILSLYRSLLREARALPIYNFRAYALEKIRYEFRTNISTLGSSENVTMAIEEAKRQLALIQRQKVIQQFYGTSDKLVIE
jgi:LYR motif-containing protein 4